MGMMSGNTGQPQVLQTLLPNFTRVPAAYSTAHSAQRQHTASQVQDDKRDVQPVLSCAPSSLRLLNSHTATSLFGTERIALLPDANTTDNNFQQTTTIFHVPYKLECMAILKIQIFISSLMSPSFVVKKSPL